ncbi:DUF7573 domain-containing protein [Halomicrococcus gelatinilyticus]|uniref:DUF7573 domain-containing protein n=1 Tax=Halomicrococcus gelatinilyticus TaxID=1702103 RepID=UPI002E12FB27
MSRDASLSDYAATDSDGDDEREAATDDAADDPDAAPELDGVDPAQATYAWVPDGAACDRCAATVTARWRDGDDLVCADCKDW